jgi:hypothetical protein
LGDDVSDFEERDTEQASTLSAKGRTCSAYSPRWYSRCQRVSEQGRYDVAPAGHGHRVVFDHDLPHGRMSGERCPDARVVVLEEAFPMSFDARMSPASLLVGFVVEGDCPTPVIRNPTLLTGHASSMR